MSWLALGITLLGAAASAYNTQQTAKKQDRALAAQIKQQMLDAFYTDTPEWKGQIVSQARQAMFQAVEGLTT